MKKSAFLFFIGIFLTFFSCKKKLTLDEHIDSVYDFSYSLTAHNLNAKKEVSRLDFYYFPPFLKKIMSAQFKEADGTSLMMIERFHPEHKGELEAQNYYMPDFDNGEWVEEVLVLIEEKRIADEINLLEQLENESEYLVEYSEPDDVEAAVENTEPAAKESNQENSEFQAEEKTESYVLSDNAMSSMQFEKEIFIPPQDRGDNTIIHASNGRVVRSFYDNFERLIKKEEWKIKSLTDSVLNKTEAYDFASDEARTPSTKTVTEEKISRVYYYNEKALCERVFEYKVLEQERILDSKTEFTYNDEGKILSEEAFDYSEKTASSKKRVFSYNKTDEIPPDSYYYENGILKMSTVYSSEKNYVSKIFFDDSYSVTTYYEDGIRVKDVYIFDGEVLRVKNYE